MLTAQAARSLGAFFADKYSPNGQDTSITQVKGTGSGKV